MQNPEANVPIALLSQSGEAGRHLRDALAGAGTPIVYEAPAAQLDRQALEESGARVVVVNLDADVESHLDDVYALLDDDRYNVIFDESGVSSRLSGWEQARWARHLAAKIRGSDNADPPRPEGAEAPPSPAPVVVAVAASAIVDEVAVSRDAEPLHAVAAEPVVAELVHEEPVEAQRAHDIVESADAPTSAPDLSVEVDEPPPRNVEDLVFEAYGVVDTPAPPPVVAPAAPVDDDALDFAHLDALLDASPAAPAATDEPLLDWELPATPTAPPAPPAPLALEPDFDLPAPPPVQGPKATPALAAAPPAPAVSPFDFDFDAPAEASAPVTEPPAPTPVKDEADDDFEFAWNAPAAEADAASDPRVDVPGELVVATPEVFAGLELVSIDEPADDDVLPSKPVATPSAEEDALGFGDLGDFADFDLPDEEVASPRGGTPERQEPVDLDALLSGRSEAAVEEPLDVGASLAAAADDIRSAGDTKTPVTFELLDLDWADAPKDDEGKPAEAPVVAAPPPVLGSALAWTLDPLDGEEDATPAAPPTGPAQFGIETVSAAEYLAPEVEATEEPPPVSLGGLSLELMPIEEAIAPSGAATGDVVREAWLDTSAISSPKAVVRKVWVLGASIGGPEAVREFLAQIPADYPALFLLAQHMGAEFMDIMAQQLAKTTKLMVRKPQHGERVGHGDLVIVPVTHRLRVDPQGVIVLEALPAGGPPHVPSIDDLLTDIAERFGSSAGTIVFSGMAEDAATGAKQLAAKGGRVYVQDPDTCVISAMVDGVIETGVVAFTGSPAALAERVLAERPAAGKTS